MPEPEPPPRCDHPDHRPPLRPGSYQINIVDVVVTEDNQIIQMSEYRCPKCGQVTSLRHTFKAAGA